MKPCAALHSPNTLDASFCVEVLEEAVARHVAPDIFDTDQGSRFTSDGFTDILKGHAIRIGMGGRGRWTDNVFVERPWRSVEYEEAYPKACESLSEARARCDTAASSTTRRGSARA